MQTLHPPISRTESRLAKPALPRAPFDTTTCLLRALVWLAALAIATVFIWLAGYIIVKGLPHLSPGLFETAYTTENVSMLPAIVITLLMIAITLLFAVPAGIGAAICLVEYTGKKSRLAALTRLTAESLAGIPSIIYGLFGFLLFVVACGMGFSILSGALTLAIMILPLIIRTTEEALKSVPGSWREGSIALGAGQLHTLFRIVLPAAAPGIIAGIILSIGRIAGESAALLYTAGTVAAMPQNFLSSGRTLSVHMYALFSEGLYINQAHATALVLLLIALFVNIASGAIAARFIRKNA